MALRKPLVLISGIPQQLGAADALEASPYDLIDRAIGSDWVYVYDVEGDNSLISRTNGSVTIAYVYNSGGYLIQKNNGTQKIDYSYNANGNLIAKTRGLL